MVVRRLGVWSVARIYGALSATFGLIAGVILGLLSMVGMGLAAESGDAPPFLGPLFGFGAVVFLPLIYGVIGLVIGAVSAGLYNVFAGLVGGVELDIQ